jgi:hypothetical protein
MFRDRVMSTLEWSLVAGFVGGWALNVVREANDGSSNLLFGLFAAVGLLISRYRGEPQPDVRISLKAILNVGGALFAFAMLTYAVEWWQDATAVPCRDRAHRVQTAKWPIAALEPRVRGALKSLGYRLYNHDQASSQAPE